MTKEEEQDLVKAILDGEKDKFAIIVKEYQEQVKDLTYRMVGNRIDIDEAAQQVFVSLYLSLPRFRFQSRLNTFIYRITVNVVSKMYGKAARTVSYDETLYDGASDEPNQEQRMIREEQKARLRKAIGRLKPEQRTALVLYTYDELSYNEIAETMGCTLSKVETLIFRAKQNLRKMLDPTNVKGDK